MRPVGVEPTTYCLKGNHSNHWVTIPSCVPIFKSQLQIMSGLDGFEPPVCTTKKYRVANYSITHIDWLRRRGLLKQRKVEYGSDRTRTCIKYIRSVLLCQLSNIPFPSIGNVREKLALNKSRIYSKLPDILLPYSFILFAKWQVTTAKLNS